MTFYNTKNDRTFIFKFNLLGVKTLKNLNYVTSWILGATYVK